MRELKVIVLDKSSDLDDLVMADVVLARIGKEYGYMAIANNADNGVILIKQTYPRSEVVEEFVLKREMTRSRITGELQSLQSQIISNRYQPNEECFDNYKDILQEAGLWQL